MRIFSSQYVSSFWVPASLYWSIHTAAGSVLPDTAYLFNLDSVHNPWIHKKTDRVFNILLDKQFVEKIFINLFQEGSPFLQFFLDSLCGVHQRKNYLIFPVTGKIRQLFQDIICEYYDRNIFNEEVMTAKLQAFIYGRIYYQAAPSRIHQEILSFLHSNIYNYIHTKKGPCKVYPAPFAVKLFTDDDTTIVEPDISVIYDPGKLTDRGCTGAPDWVIEIVSPGNPGNDYVRKLNLYLDAGVREYWIVNPGNHTVFVYSLEKATFESISHTFQDNIEVGIFDDLSICLKEYTQI